MLARPREREGLQPRELPRVDGLRGADERAAVARLHLDEDMAARVLSDEVELAVSGTRIAGDDADPAPFERAGRRGLTKVSERTARVGHA